MDDQAKSSSELGFEVGCLHSGINAQRQWSALMRWTLGGSQILYTSPERLQDQRLVSFLSKNPPGLVVVDEAHCISTWGRRFRPCYLRLGELIPKLSTPPVLAMTATANDVTRRDIVDVLQLGKPTTMTVPLTFSNISLSATNASKWDRAQILGDLAGQDLNLPMIIFCVLKKHCQAVTEYLTSLRVHTFAYHSGFSADDRKDIHAQFQATKRSVLVATSAYEMGVHNADIRTVVHYGLPISMESYVQGVGRAGRDGRPARAVLLYSDSDLDILDSMEALSLGREQGTDNRQLNMAAQEVYAYALTRRCRVNFVRGYFYGRPGQPIGLPCGICDSCQRQRNSQLVPDEYVARSTQALKRWRSATASRIGKHAFTILTDKEIARIVVSQRQGDSEMIQVSGVRRPVIERFQGEIAAVLKSTAAECT